MKIFVHDGSQHPELNNNNEEEAIGDIIKIIRMIAISTEAIRRSEVQNSPSYPNYISHDTKKILNLLTKILILQINQVLCYCN